MRKNVSANGGVASDVISSARRLYVDPERQCPPRYG